MIELRYKLCVAEHYAFKYNDDFIFMDVNTLDVYVLGGVEYSIIKSIKGRSGDNKLSRLRQQYGKIEIDVKIEDLLKNGILRHNEDANGVIASRNNDNELERISTIDMLLSEDCNLACKYCYVKNGKYLGKTDQMKIDIAKSTIDFLIQRSGEKRDLQICFFGGEPLINYRLLKKIVEYAKEEGEKYKKYFHFTMTTNGTLLSEKIVEFLGKHRIRVTLSIDGDEQSHDMNRPFSGSGGSYKEIVEALKMLNQHNVGYAARTTVSSLTLNKIAENFKHLLAIGFKRIHIENAYSPTGDVFISNKTDIAEAKRQFSQITDNILKKIDSDRPFEYEEIPLPLGNIVNKRAVSYGCRAGRGYYAVDVHGDIYLCHRLVGDKHFLMGNVVQGRFDTIFSETISKEMNVENRKKCNKCWARHLCGGGCYAVNYEFNKDISLAPNIYCQQKKHSIKLALTVYANAAQ